LAVLVSTGKAKEAIGVQLTHEQVKRLSDKDVEKFAKRYETYVGSKTTESPIGSFSDDSDCNHAARKNPRRVAAGKMAAEKRRLAHEEQKKAAEAYYAENEAKKKAATAAPESAPSKEGESPKSGGLFGLSANQWIGIGGIGLSLLGIYYKR